MHYQKRYSTLYPLVDRLNHTKSYLWGRQMNTDTNGYLVLKSSYVPPTGWQMTTKYWRAKKYPKSDLRDGQMTKGTDRYLVLKFYQVLPMG